MPVGLDVEGTRYREGETSRAKQEEKMDGGKKKTNKGRMRNEWKERDGEMEVGVINQARRFQPSNDFHWGGDAALLKERDKQFLRQSQPFDNSWRGLETGVKHGTIPLCINYRVELRRFKLFPDSGPTPRSSLSPVLTEVRAFFNCGVSLKYEKEWPWKFSWIVSLFFGIIEIRQEDENSNEHPLPHKNFE